MSRLQPLANRILVLPIVVEEMTASGIILAESPREKPLRGEVIAVGEGTKDEKMLLSAGDIVLYKRGVGHEMEFEHEKYILMSQFDILAVIKDS